MTTRKKDHNCKGYHEYVQPSCAFASGVIPDGWHCIERCDQGEEYPDDQAAARGAGYFVGKWVRCLSVGQHYVVPDREATCRSDNWYYRIPSASHTFGPVIAKTEQTAREIIRQVRNLKRLPVGTEVWRRQ